MDRTSQPCPRHARRHRPHAWAVTSLILPLMVATLGITRPAHASQGEASVWWGASLANANAVTDGAMLGVSSELGLNLDITDFWSVDLGVEGAYHFGKTTDDMKVDPFFAQHLFAGFRYNLDVFVFVPYVGVTVDAFLRRPPRAANLAPRPGVGASLNMGLDWRFARHWSTGVRAELHILDSELFRFPAYSTFGLNVSYNFRL